MDPLGLAVDFSYARPDPAEMAAAGIKLALAYLGSGKPRPTPDYIAACQATGIAFAFIQESYARRAYEGYDAGAVDAGVAERDADAAGYPEECAIYVALGDTNRSDAAAHAAGIAEYARGFGDALRRPTFGGYGSREAVDAACAAQPKMAYRWTVETWGANFEGYDHIVQMANVASPVDGADLDYLFVADVGQWPRPTQPAPAPTPPPDPNAGDDDMAGPKPIDWTTPSGKAKDIITVASDGSAFTEYPDPKSSGAKWGRFPIAGPQAATGRYQGKIQAASAITVVETNGMLIAYLAAEDGRVIQVSWAEANPAPSSTDTSLWRADPLPIA